MPYYCVNTYPTPKKIHFCGCKFALLPDSWVNDQSAQDINLIYEAKRTKTSIPERLLNEAAKNLDCLCKKDNYYDAQQEAEETYGNVEPCERCHPELDDGVPDWLVPCIGYAPTLPSNCCLKP